MPGPNLHDIVRRAAGVPSRIATAADGELLGRFVNERDAVAFAELVRRHGSMVLGVCRRELGDGPDADDACQATFLVLARKAAAVRRADAVGAWLYGVARRVARKQGKSAARRRGRETPLADIPGPDTTAAVSWRDGLHVLDEELARLPDTYRAPLVLCNLEGRTQDEAARQLGWSLGSFRGRLERGRARLRDRLTRRGVGLAVLAAAAVARPGSVASAMQMSIINTAATIAAGEALAVPVTVAALAEGAIRAMIISKIQWAVGVVAACGMLTVGGVWATGQGPGIGGAPFPGGVPVRPVAGNEASGESAVAPKSSGNQRMHSFKNLKQIMLAIHNYHNAYGYLPSDIRDKNGKAILSWRVAILPFLEQDAVFGGFKTDEPWDSEANLRMLQQMPVVYSLGNERKTPTHTFYQVFAGPNTPLHPMFQRGGVQGGVPGIAGLGGVLPPGGPAGGQFGVEAGLAGVAIVKLSSITDGTPNTFGVVEAGPPVPWTKPADIPFDPKKPLKLVTPFSNEWHAATMDGAAYALKRDIDSDLLRRLITINDGEPVPPLSQLRAPRIAETPEEQAQLKKLIDQNRIIIDQIHDLMRQHAELLTGQNNKLGDLGAAEELADRLGGIAVELAERNKMLRDKTAGPAPTKYTPKP